MKLQIITFIFLQIIFQCKCDIRIISPKTSILENNGSLTHSMALFGRPNYGGQLIGKLYLAPISNSDGCKLFNKSQMPSWTDESHDYILLLKRGHCHFVEKVRNAQEASAKGVVIYDNKKTAILPLMSDDGTGGDVNIPSVLIQERDGEVLIDLLKNNTTVIISLSWQVPHPDNRVEWELWSSSRDLKTHSFIRDFKDVFRALENNSLFTPRYEVFDGKEWGCLDMGSRCKKLCVDGGKFCAYDPEADPDIGLDGIDVLQEDMRQLCIWQLVGNITQNATKWWDYVSIFDELCSIKNATKEQFNLQCSEKAQEKVGLNLEAVRDCVKINGSILLQQQMQQKTKYGIVSTPRIVVNDLKHYGDISCPHPVELGMCSPLRMICSGFLDGTQPKACENSYWKQMCYPPNEIDDCGDCKLKSHSDWNSRCSGCDGKVNSGKVKDACGVCGGDGEIDRCGKCLSRKDVAWDKSCTDCEGIVNGDAQLDPCGVCKGHGSFDACGVCLDQFDPKRQNYECKVDNDPDAVRVKMYMKNIPLRSFSAQNADVFKNAVAKVCDVSERNVIVKSVLDNGLGGSAVFAFIITKNSEEKTKVKKLLLAPTAAQEIAVRISATSSLSSDVVITSVDSGEPTLSKNITSNSGTIVITIIISLAILGAVGYYVMWRREKRIRRDLNDLFAKYTPLVSMEDDQDNNGAPLV